MQRIESSTNALENDGRAIKDYISASQCSEEVVDGSSASVDEIAGLSSRISEDAATLVEQQLFIPEIGDETFRASLNAAFMKNAEIFQPWSTIGVDQWIDSARWWLLRVSP